MVMDITTRKETFFIDLSVGSNKRVQCIAEHFSKLVPKNTWHCFEWMFNRSRTLLFCQFKTTQNNCMKSNFQNVLKEQAR